MLDPVLERMVLEIAALRRQVDRMEQREGPLIFVPLAAPLTSTSYDGDDTVTAGSVTTIDTSAVFGAPAGMKAIVVRLSASWTGAGTTRNLQLRPTGTTNVPFLIRSAVAGSVVDGQGIVKCDADGDFDLACGGGENAGSVLMEIHGYWI